MPGHQAPESPEFSAGSSLSLSSSLMPEGDAYFFPPFSKSTRSSGGYKKQVRSLQNCRCSWGPLAKRCSSVSSKALKCHLSWLSLAGTAPSILLLTLPEPGSLKQEVTLTLHLPRRRLNNDKMKPSKAPQFFPLGVSQSLTLTPSISHET